MGLVERIVECNNLKEHLPGLKVKLVHDDTLILFLNMDGTFYISIKCLKLAKDSDEKLAYFLCHEMSHFLLGHQPLRLWNGFAAVNFSKYMKSAIDKEVYDPVKEEFKERVFMQKYSCFYPQQRLMNKYYERNCDTFAVNLLKNTFSDKVS